ncbi:MAG: hypothetical protein JKY61_06295 [Planctomycetes bacterium]|nr:hypothetical protein [Planctomycetota bacterium]
MVIFCVRTGGRTHIMQTAGEKLNPADVPFLFLSHGGEDIPIRRGWNYYGFNSETGEHHSEPAGEADSLRAKFFVVLGLSTPWKANLEPDLADPPVGDQSRPAQALVQIFRRGVFYRVAISTDGFEDLAVEFFFDDSVVRALDGCFVRIMPGMEIMSVTDGVPDKQPPLSWLEFVIWAASLLGLDPEVLLSPRRSLPTKRGPSGGELARSVPRGFREVISATAVAVDDKQARARDAVEQRRWLSSGVGLTELLDSRHGVVMPIERPNLRPEEIINVDEYDLSMSVGASLAGIDKAALAAAEEAAIPAADVLLEDLQRLLADHEAGFNAVRDAIKTATEPLAQVLQAYLRGFQGKSLDPVARDKYAKGLSALLLGLDRGLRCSSEGCELPARLRRKKNESFEFTHEGKTSGHGGQLVVPVDLTIISRDRS